MGETILLPLREEGGEGGEDLERRGERRSMEGRGPYSVT